MTNPMKRRRRKPVPKKPVLIEFPEDLIDLIDRSAEAQDLDRSKFIRLATREKLRAQGIL